MAKETPERKPRGFGKFSDLMKKLVRNDAGAVAGPRALTGARTPRDNLMFGRANPARRPTEREIVT